MLSVTTPIWGTANNHGVKGHIKEVGKKNRERGVSGASWAPCPGTRVTKKKSANGGTEDKGAFKTELFPRGPRGGGQVHGRTKD